MNRLLTNVPVLIASLMLAGCAASAPATKATTAAPDTTKPASTTAATTAKTRQQPAEDLSKYRPKFQAPAEPKAPQPRGFIVPTANVNTLIDQRLRDQAYTNQNVKYTSGYRIQAYVGLERDEAMAIRRAVISRYPEETDYIVFKQPIYRLFVGDYATRLDAERAMQRIKPLAPKASLEPAQVLINKTRF